MIIMIIVIIAIIITIVSIIIIIIMIISLNGPLRLEPYRVAQGRQGASLGTDCAAAAMGYIRS